ncbi:hypothetical protein OAW20_01900 [Gammaproteobacteria bacterium]|nr:hypothetical protein [Gammaproteobacteria bacterium]
MKKLLVPLLMYLSFNIATEDLYGISAKCDDSVLTIKQHNITTAATTVLSNSISCSGVNSASSVDTVKGLFYVVQGTGEIIVYDYVNNTHTVTPAPEDGTTRYIIPYKDKSVSSIITTGTDAEDNSSTTILGSLDISDSNGNTLIEQNSDGTSIEIGEDSSGETGLIISNTADSLDITDGDGETVIEKKADGSVHIGENSLVTVEENGVQQLYATNVSDEQININIKKGTDLLIDGVSVAGSLSTNATNIATNTTDIATNKTSIATNTTDIATNKTSIATNTTDIATNKTSIATNVTNIASNTAEIATYTDSITSNTTAVAALGSDLSTFKASANSQMNYMKSDYSSGIASAVAMSQFNLAQDGFSIGVGRGSYNDENETAFGLGYGGEFKNGTLFKLQASKSGDASGVGLTISF